MTLQEERNNYYSHYFNFKRMPLQKLERVLGELWEKRYTDHDISCYNEHRIAARVYLERTKKGESLIFHLQNFLG
jgi:hypothetical protein